MINTNVFRFCGANALPTFAKNLPHGVQAFLTYLIMKKPYETSVLETPFMKPDAYGALNFPVYYSAAFEFPSAQATSDAFAGRSMEHAYARISNPTVQYLERRVQAYTGAFSVTALNTGMAAIVYALTAVAGTGVNIVASKHLFGNTVSFLKDTLGGLGVETRFVDTTDPAAVDAAIDEHTGALFFEIITNPQLYVADIQALATITHNKHVPLIADTTIVPFPAFHAHDFGVDIEVVSSTKYISGGATGLGGLLLDYGEFDWSASANPSLRERTKRFGKHAAFTHRVKTELITNLGAMMVPQVAYMETLGLETLQIRFRRQAETTLFLAKECQRIPNIKKVNYTGLADNPYYNISQRQFGSLPGAVFTIDLPSREAAFRFVDRLKVIRRATNLFDHKSLAIHPASTIFVHFTAEEKALMDVSENTVRISVGLEDPQDLLADIRQAAAAD